MSAVALAATEAAARPQPPRAAAGARPRGAVRPRRPGRRATQTVDIPERVYRGPHYSDVFVKAWAKATALDVDTNPEHCNAHVKEMARFCGLSVRDFERALTEGRTPGPDGGAPEFLTQRMTRSTGIGRTAIRQVRPVTDTERFVTVPVAMCDALEPRRLRAALLLAHAAKYTPGYEPTAAELAGELFHHHGDSAGQPLHPKTAGRIMRELGTTGWATTGHRAGYQGRHHVTVHHTPLRPVPVSEPTTATPADTPATQAEAGPVQLELDLFAASAPAVADEPGGTSSSAGASADIHGGSAGHTGGGSLAIKEDGGVVTDEVGAPQEVGGSRRRRGTGSRPATPASDLAGGTFGPGTSRAPRGTRTTPAPSTTTPYGGPELRWTRRIHESLAPVRHLLDGASRFMLRRAAREIGRQLDDAAVTLMTPQRMAARIGARYRDAGPIRDLGAWLLTVAIVPRGCGQPLCEDGTVWPTGARCETCAHQRQVTGEHWRQARAWGDRLTTLRADRTAVKATYRQRSSATDAEVLAVAAEHGPAAALHRYGVLRAGELLRAAYGALPELPAPAPVMVAPRPGPAAPFPHMPEEAPVRNHVPDEFRNAAGRARADTDISRPCPHPGCLAEAWRPCKTPRGRDRATPHTARTAAAPAREEES